MRFGENNVLYPKYIDIMNFRGYGGDVHIPPYSFCLLFKKTVKEQEHGLYSNQIIHNFDLKKKNRRMNNKKIMKRGPQGAPLLFLYEVSIVVSFS